MYDYTYQKLTQAIECLSTDEGDVRERLKNAYIYYLNMLQINNFPEDLYSDWQYIQYNMTKFKSRKLSSIELLQKRIGIYESNNEGYVEITMSRIKNKTGKKIAEKIWLVWVRLHEIKFG